MLAICPYSWPQLLLRPTILVPAQRVLFRPFSAMFPLAVLYFFFHLVPRIMPCVGYGLVPYVEHELSTSIAYVVLVNLSFRFPLFSEFHHWTHAWANGLSGFSLGICEGRCQVFFSSAFVILQVSHPYNRTAMMFDLKILNLVSRRNSPVLHTFESR